MTNSTDRMSEKKGLPPGTLIHIGKTLNSESVITALKYNANELQETEIKSIEELLVFVNSNHTVWINISGLCNIDMIKDIGKHFDIHPLVLEDILNTNQRVKFEDFDDYFYLVLKNLTHKEENFKFTCEQISILSVKNIVFTFCESSLDSGFRYLRERLNTPKSRIRTEGISYLAYAIVDTIVDQYFCILDQLDEITESVDTELLNNPDESVLGKIQQVKRELIHIRRSISPLRNALQNMVKSESTLISNKTTDIYYKDVYDHVLRILESLDMYRDLASNLLEIYLTNISNKMNAVMKVLTIFASIFIPMTFIAGVYGMNFKYMPELEWKWSYPLVWCVFILIAVTLVVFFKRKKMF